MNKYKKLLGNSLVFAIGNLGSKLITILLIPLYTYTLTTRQYGSVDIITTTINLLLPVVSLSAFDAVLRFVLDKNEDNSIVLSNAVVITILGAIVAITLIPIFKLLGFNHCFLMYIMLVLQATQSMFSEYARASGKVKLFAFNGLLNATVLGASNLVLLYFFHYGIAGYILSIIIASIFSIILLVSIMKLRLVIDLKKVRWAVIKKILTYSIPLIPNALAWWASNASNRYFILLFVGISANGLFAVANKIPNLLNMLNTIFFQSWQLSAVEEYDSKDKSEFYSKIFSYYYKIFFLCGSLLITVIKPLMSILVSNQFYNSWKLIPLLTMSVIYSCFSSFLGTNYIAARKTIGVMVTTVMGALVNIALCLLLIPKLGANGAGLASSISFFVIWLYRVFDTRKFVIIKIDILNFIMNNVVLIFQILVLLIVNSLTLIILVEMVLLIILFFINDKFILSFVSMMRRK